MKTLTLRDYQKDAILSLTKAWESGMQRPAVVLPTGMGKTVIFAEIIKRAVESGHRPLVMAHRDELVSQAVEKIEDALTGANIGIIKATRNEYEGRDVVVGSMQTLGRPVRLAAVPSDAFDLVIIDECHHAAADGYMRILKHFGCFDPERGSRAAGFTATMTRGDSRGLGVVWQDVVCTRDIMDGITGGYLVNPRGYMVTVDGLDLASVARAAGDFRDGSLGDAMIEAGAPKAAAEAYHEHGTRADGTLRPGILFASTKAATQAFADEFNAAGIPTAVVLGETPKDDRKAIYAATKAGTNIVIASCSVLTEGFDLPEVEIAVIARPTSNEGLYVQMVGRVLRPAPWAGKTEATILDIVGVSGRIRLAGRINLSKRLGIAPEDGESLVEAANREAQEKCLVAGTLVQPSETVAIDLFHQSSSAWLKTYKGVWFIPTRDHTYFLWPTSDGKYSVGRCGTYTTKGGQWLNGKRAYPQDAAMAWAEDAAGGEDPSIASRSSSWRKRGRASDAQKAHLARCGIEFDPAISKNDASNMISIYLASKLLDPR